MATPVGKPAVRSLLLFDESDVLGASLAEILSEDPEDDGGFDLMLLLESEEDVLPGLMEAFGASSSYSYSLETIEEVDEEPALGATVAESSAPASPCNPSPHRAGLTDRTNHLEAGPQQKRLSHWSRDVEPLDAMDSEDEMVPIPKLRRTISECIPTPLSMLTSPNKISAGGGGVSNALTVQTVIPSHESPKDAIRRITPGTMVDLLDGKWAECYDRLVIVDARYPYEYLGGHIPKASNICSVDAAERMLFSPEMLEADERTLLVFHCEFSSERAPRMALHIRNLDRTINAARYPHLTYPEIYILEGGYRAYYQQFRERCEPVGQYVPMRTQRFRDDLRFHQRMKHSTATSNGSTLGFNGNKYNRSKVRACAGGVGLRKSASSASMMSFCSAPSYIPPRLAPGEMMPEEFPSSDGPDIFQMSSSASTNCFI